MEKYLAAFGALPNIRNEHWQKLAGYFSNFEKAWQAHAGELKKAGLTDKWIQDFQIFRGQNDPSKIYKQLQDLEIKLLPIYDVLYPELLKEAYNAPFLLYLKGELTKQDRGQTIGIVGSRRGTDYGRRITYEVAKELGQSGITIVSGLALGLDTEAHKGALAGGGRTIAVLANGLDKIYPTSNTALARNIMEHGCIISEQPIGMPPLKQNFPARNRIISGLSQGVLITEAGEGSGTLHTASFALEQNRQLYSVPGPIYNPLSKGPNNLLKQGAKPVTGSGDILEDFGIEIETVAAVPENETEKAIFDVLKHEPLHIDEIAAKAKANLDEISRTLTLMEIGGKVRHLGGMVYALK